MLPSLIIFLCSYDCVERQPFSSLHLFRREFKKIKTNFKHRKCYFTCLSFEFGLYLFEFAPKKV